ncbi:MAG: UDP-N-acetylmuramoyl-tripeptide--D-alanyl-D-alanine ligase [Spirochaetes bacterium]|nr:UDP-N-acetylmuramoyl-tripeptide--D-alanyl-D-alanine ligase [Spirochaetota bacterium]
MRVEFQTTAGLISDWTGGTLIQGERDMRIDSISTDSRDIEKGSLFVPIVGEKFDGHDFIHDLVKDSRISAYLTMRNEACYTENSGVAAIQCNDTLAAYGMLAYQHRKSMQTKIIAITGTNGKTTTKELVWSILEKKYSTLKNEKNYNNEIGVPYTLLGLKKKHEWAAIELGMNHPGEIDRLSRISRPDVALITNIGEGHLEYLGSIENVAEAKAEILNGMKNGSTIILNRDTDYYDLLEAKAAGAGLNVLTFGLSENSDVRPDAYELNSSSIKIRYNNEEYAVPLFGIHNVYNVMAAIAAAEFIGIEKGFIKEAFDNFKNVDMRSQVIDAGYTIINDSYNSNPLSARYAVQSLHKIFPGRKKIAILSDMKELGEKSEKYHAELGKLIAETGIDLLMTWGEMSENITASAVKNGMNGNIAVHFKEKDELIRFAKKSIEINNVVLIKGSRSMKMEEVVEALIR